jgi:hypothetical protein
VKAALKTFGYIIHFCSLFLVYSMATLRATRQGASKNNADELKGTFQISISVFLVGLMVLG